MMNSLSLENAPPVSKQALVGIYEQHSPGLYRYAYRLLGDRHLAEECVSETFSRFLQSMRSGRWPDQNVQGYLYRMAHNWATDQFRKRSLETVELDAEVHSDPLGNPAQLFAQDTERERVRQALMALPEDQRKVVVLRLLEQWSHEEVANALGKTVEATRALQHRALTALRRLLVADDQEV